MPYLEKTRTPEPYPDFSCDSCGVVYKDESGIWETQEAIRIVNYCGYGSIFGDGAVIDWVICQHCILKRFSDLITK